MTDEELEETTNHYAGKLHKWRQKIFNNKTRRCCTLKNIKQVVGQVAKKVYANKKTNAAIGTVGAMALTGVAYFASAQWGFNPLGLENTDFVNLLAAEAVATIGLVAPGVLGAGYQTVDEFDKMAAAKKQAKVAKKQSKKEGVVLSPAKQAGKLAKKLGVTEDAALLIVKQQEQTRKEAQAKKDAAKESLLVSKLAKQLHVSEEQAKAIRAEQIRNAQK
jgi:hypothetical protein